MLSLKSVAYMCKGTYVKLKSQKNVLILETKIYLNVFKVLRYNQ